MSFDGNRRLPGAYRRDLGDSTDFTFTAWVKWNGGNAWQRIFDLGNGTSNKLFLTRAPGSNTMRFAITSNGCIAGNSTAGAPYWYVDSCRDHILAAILENSSSTAPWSTRKRSPSTPAKSAPRNELPRKSLVGSGPALQWIPRQRSLILISRA
jgi:hypothetical protein